MTQQQLVSHNQRHLSPQIFLNWRTYVTFSAQFYEKFYENEKTQLRSSVLTSLTVSEKNKQNKSISVDTHLDRGDDNEILDISPRQAWLCTENQRDHAGG
jgi:hypothetical protein